MKPLAKRICSYALLALICVIVCFSVAFAQVDSTGTGGGGGDDGGGITLTPKQIVWMAATSLGSFLIGLAIKKWPVLEGYSNRLIPYTIAVIAIVGYVIVLHVGLVEAAMMAGASSFGAVLLAEGPLKALTKAPRAYN